jgi:hypothetical protein
VYHLNNKPSRDKIIMPSQKEQRKELSEEERKFYEEKLKLLEEDYQDCIKYFQGFDSVEEYERDQCGYLYGRPPTEEEYVKWKTNQEKCAQLEYEAELDYAEFERVQAEKKKKQADCLYD